MTPDTDKPTNLGRTLALVVGVALLAGAAYVGLVVGEPIGATILVVIGGSALAGWAKARRR